jgi:hypothetical protein
MMKRMSNNLMCLMAVDPEVLLGGKVGHWTRSAKSCQQLANPSNPAWDPNP